MYKKGESRHEAAEGAIQQGLLVVNYFDIVARTPDPQLFAFLRAAFAAGM